jgi:hypothetical protein
MFPVLELVDLRLSDEGHDNSSNSRSSNDDALSPSSTGSGGTDGHPLLPPSARDEGDCHGGRDGARHHYHHHHQQQQQQQQQQQSSSPSLFPVPRNKAHAGFTYGALLPSPPPTEKKLGASSIRDWLLPPPRHYSRRRPLLYLSTRAGAVLLASLVAFLLPEFELVVAFIGSLGASALAFVFPGVLAWQAYPRATVGGKVAFGGLVVFGVVGGGVGAGYALKAIIRGESQC